MKILETEFKITSEKMIHHDQADFIPDIQDDSIYRVQ